MFLRTSIFSEVKSQSNEKVASYNCIRDQITHKYSPFEEQGNEVVELFIAKKGQAKQPEVAVNETEPIATREETLVDEAKVEVQQAEHVPISIEVAKRDDGVLIATNDNKNANSTMSTDAVGVIKKTDKKGCTKIADTGCLTIHVGSGFPRYPIGYEMKSIDIPKYVKVKDNGSWSSTNAKGSKLETFDPIQLLFANKRFQDLVANYSIVTWDCLRLTLKIDIPIGVAGALMMVSTAGMEHWSSDLGMEVLYDSPHFVTSRGSFRYCLEFPWNHIFPAYELDTSEVKVWRQNLAFLFVDTAFSCSDSSTTSLNYQIYLEPVGVKVGMPRAIKRTTPVVPHTGYINIEDNWWEAWNVTARPPKAKGVKAQGMTEDFNTLPIQQICCSETPVLTELSADCPDLRALCSTWNREGNIAFTSDPTIHNFCLWPNDHGRVVTGAPGVKTSLISLFITDYQPGFTLTPEGSHPLSYVWNQFAYFHGDMYYRFVIRKCKTSVGPWTGTIGINVYNDSNNYPRIYYPDEKILDIKYVNTASVIACPIMRHVVVSSDVMPGPYTTFSFDFVSDDPEYLVPTDFVIDVYSKIGDNFIVCNPRIGNGEFPAVLEQGFFAESLQQLLTVAATTPTSELVGKMASFAAKYAISPSEAEKEMPYPVVDALDFVKSAANHIKNWVGMSAPSAPVSSTFTRVSNYGDHTAINAPVPVHGTTTSLGPFSGSHSRAIFMNPKIDLLTFNTFLSQYVYYTDFVFNDTTRQSVDINVPNAPITGSFKGVSHHVIMQMFDEFHADCDIVLRFQASQMANATFRIYLLPQCGYVRSVTELDGDYVDMLPVQEISVKGATLMRLKLPFPPLSRGSSSYPRLGLLVIAPKLFPANNKINVKVFIKWSNVWLFRPTYRVGYDGLVPSISRKGKK